MTDKTDNELIAEFMGFVPEKSSLGNTWRHPDKMGVYGGAGMLIKYDSDWSWLMPVVEKIESLGYGYTVDPWGLVVIDYTTGNEEERVSFQNDDNYPKIFQYYRTTVDFIKWYNSQNNHP